jgi:HTH-like domain
VVAAEAIPVQVACPGGGLVDLGLLRLAAATAVGPRDPPRLADQPGRRLHQRSRGTYGARRVHAELRLGHQVVVGHGAVESLMRRAGLEGVTGRPKFRRGLRPEATATDLVQRQFTRTGPDQLWLTDITEHPTREGKPYCAVVLDACSRRVVGSLDRRHPDRGAGDQRPRDGDPVPPADRGDADPLRPGSAARVQGVVATLPCWGERR